MGVERRRREPLAAGAQQVGCANLAGADGADVGGAGEPRQDQSERGRAAEITESERRGLGRQQRRVEPWRHGRSLLPPLFPPKAVPPVAAKTRTPAFAHWIPPSAGNS